MKKNIVEECIVSSSSLQRKAKFIAEKLFSLDEDDFYEEPTSKINSLDYYENIDEKEESSDSFGICKKRSLDIENPNQFQFDDSNIIKYNDNNQIDIFGHKIIQKHDYFHVPNCANDFNNSQNSSQNIENEIYLQKEVQPQDQPNIISNKFKKKLKQKKIKRKKFPPLKKCQKIKKKSHSKFNFESLALRNIKTNFASGLIQFIQFKQELTIGFNDKKADFYKNIVKYLYLKLPALRSFSGWREVNFKFQIWSDQTYGNGIRKLSLLFFTKSYVQNYIHSSRVKQEYKEEYFKKIEKFVQGIQNNQLFNSFNFNL